MVCPCFVVWLFVRLFAQRKEKKRRVSKEREREREREETVDRCIARARQRTRNKIGPWKTSSGSGERKRGRELEPTPHAHHTHTTQRVWGSCFVCVSVSVFVWLYLCVRWLRSTQQPAQRSEEAEGGKQRAACGLFSFFQTNRTTMHTHTHTHLCWGLSMAKNKCRISANTRLNYLQPVFAHARHAELSFDLGFFCDGTIRVTKRQGA